MDHCPRTMNQLVMPKQTVSWKQWHSLRNPIPVFLKTHVLKQWKLSNKHGWTN
ncbi:putative PB1-F2 protein [Influenza A virus (A/swine/Hong Kong/97/1979(H1N1))]|uniref:Putative PB1-F2 protein n=18 Tax=H1N1 subtype TaxID=114727 RepID=F0TWT9_9INFA|nr:putative PB1-F2 protein [Influenza A virus (A/swine/Tennessee/62/1977(H1N1))]ABR28579.1 putative PB1-F2 protein [Influenza A virus (A/swine/Tennessee/79/1977(H1N1))]ABU80208.1 putative PB1-F2 protein [Influenza A virus (A/swine/Tennessee/61/1977(H1N1))]ABU80219.1 putative PB1-F2 protein [Influenza A virus (A/swine/Tennessee/96/1977(H1N1))]ABU87915.1 putative PB1-F2 protein [Influenza A virus (A/swine/Tennessee/25/1977(H1N1))]ABW36386.1 putative PB1-F2 protein [Influenza A virus (A/swine/Iow